MEIRRYTPADKSLWDTFAAASRNATFLFRRDYMDYHADRFADCSLMAFSGGKLRALLPASVNGTTLTSHGGLTYGGWMLPDRGFDAEDCGSLWLAWLEYCRDEGIETVIYKPLPFFYATRPAQGDLYMLFLCGARTAATDISSTIDLTANPGMNTLRRRHLKHAPADFRTTTASGDDAEAPEAIRRFHAMLTACLAERHGVSPVHSAPELSQLMRAFPDNIVIWEGWTEESPHAAVCAYLCGRTVHCQYIATTPEGRQSNLLTPLVAAMTEHYTREGYRYFDFGISTERGGRVLNAGLNRQKTSFGATGTAYQRFEFSVSSALESLRNALRQTP